MSTIRHTDTPEFQTEYETFGPDVAPRTFDPLNTDPCPSMFSEKWQAETE